MDKKKLRVTVLAGGISAEREISIQSGEAITKALEAKGHDVHQYDVSPSDLSAFDRPCNVIFPALHGLFGEDGTLQRELESRGIPFVGSGEEASRLAMDKAATKGRFLETDIPTPNWQVVYVHKFNEKWKPAKGIGFPCVIKPLSEGSSVGCKICHDLVSAREHLAATLPKFSSMLVEQFIDGYELSVGIFGERALPVIWIKPATEFYDYQAKYTREDTQYLFDIPFQSHIISRIQGIAWDTHIAIGCRHLSRVDIMVDKRTLDIFVIEINTMPGFTAHSLLPKAAKEAGIEFSDLCEQLAYMPIFGD